MKTTKAGYAVGVIGTIIVLLWIGLLKFTPSEAAGIKPYAENSFLMSWMYKVGTVQQVSDFVGSFEIITAILLIASFFNRQMGLIGGYLGLVIFLTTLSFIITTPGVWKHMDGVLVTDFFVVKDIAFLAIMIQVIGTHTKVGTGK